jgi:hypothetical protein
MTSMPGAVKLSYRILKPGSPKDVEYRIPIDLLNLSCSMLFLRINALKNPQLKTASKVSL